MRAVVVYESMYGNTHTIATEIAAGLRTVADVDVVSTSEVTPELVAAADLLVVGGPTHAHGMTSSATRASAVEAAQKPDSALALEADVDGPGLRDWFGSLAAMPGQRAAAFDTRIQASVLVTGHASKGIGHRLEHHGRTLVAAPESFFVTKHNDLVAGESERAQHWGHALALVLTPSHAG